MVTPETAPASRSPPRPLCLTETPASPNTIMRLPALCRDPTRGTRPDRQDCNHLMQPRPGTRVRRHVCQVMMINVDIVAAGHGSLSSLASLGHFSSVSFISEEKTNLEIQKLRQELREEHDKVKRLQSQLSTNVGPLCGDKSCKQLQPFVNIITQGSCRICIRAIISKHDIQAFTAHTHCRGKGIFEKYLTLTINCQLSRFAKFVLNILSNLIWSGPTVVRARKDNVSLMEFRARGNVANSKYHIC